MDRRSFMKSAGIAVAGAAAAGTAARGGVAPPISASPAPKPVLMKVGCQRHGSGKLQFLQRFGVTHLCASPAKTDPVAGTWMGETVAAEIARVKEAGLVVESMYWGVPIEVLVPGKRDAAIEKCKKQIVEAGKGKLPILAYNLHVRKWKARTGHEDGRGGSKYPAWDLAKVEPQKKPDIGPLTEEEHWDRITHFLKAVVPVAHEAKVKLACHPNDPPMPKVNDYKIAQALDTVEGMKKFVQIQDSPFHGLTFCQGTFCEMLEKPAEQIFDVIRWFGQRGKIHQVHFRNIRGGLNKFCETYPDDGDVDMAKALRVYRDVGFAGMLMPDHVPGHEEDLEGNQAWAFAYGYIKGLIDSLRAETG